LITDDDRLRRRAKRAGLADAVLSVAEAVDLLTSFAPTMAPSPPRVTKPATYTLNADQEIFAGLREDYDGFDDWLDKVRRQSDHRTCYLVTDGDKYAAIALLKPEPDCTYALPQPVLKISTFKVGPNHAGARFGELLLKAILMDATTSDVACLYVEVLPKHEGVVAFLEEFGFKPLAEPSRKGELVMAKPLIPDEHADDLDDLSYQIRYGPPALRARQSIFVVPIQSRWHDQLFPEVAQAPGPEVQLSLFHVDRTLTHPWGNALRKAYLCHTPTQQIRAGDVLLFYRSQDAKSVTAVGIVEACIRSSHPEEVITFVGRRTVYTPDEIRLMCRSVNGLLAIRFRQDRFIQPEWPLTELRLAKVLTSWPQSVTKVRGEGVGWVRRQLESP
jgi:hypothetical protein